MSEAALESQAEDQHQATEPQEEEFDYSPLDHWGDEEREFYSSLDEYYGKAKEHAETLEALGINPDTFRGLQKSFKTRYQNWDKGFGKKMQEVAEQRKQIEAQQQRIQAENAGYQTLRQLIEPHIGEWHKMGVMPDQAAAQAFTWATSYYRDPVGTLVELAKQGGMINQLQEALGQQEYVDPRYEEMQRQMQAYQAQLEQTQGYLTQQQQAQQRAQVEPYLRQIEEFQNATNEDGTPKHPYFQQVFPQMAELIRSGQSSDLESAYNEAVWAIPDARESLLAQQAKAKAEQQNKEADKAEQAAKRVTAKSSGSKPRKSIRSELSDALSEIFPDE